MKKYFFFAVAALIAMVSCTKNEAATEPDQEIDFQVATFANTTKANVTYPTGTPFGTYAWYNGTTAFMDNQKVSYQSSVWKAEGQTYYWPKTGSLDFISYSPYNATPWLTVGKTQLTATTTGVAANADYLYSDKALEQTANTDPGKYYTPGVPTLFHHALCQVCIKIKASKLENEAHDVTWNIALKSGAKIHNYAKEGSLTLNLNAQGTGARTNGWTLPTNSVWTVAAEDFDQDLACSAQTLPYNLTTSAADILALTTVMPQALGDQKLNLSFQLTETRVNTGEVFVYDYDHVIDFKTEMGAGSPQYWQMNKKITYTVTVNPEGDEILFDPAIEDWETASGSNTINLQQ